MSLYWFYCSFLIVMYIRFFLLAITLPGAVVLSIVLALRLAKKLSYRHYLLLVLNASQLIAFVLLAYPYVETRYFPPVLPRYLASIASNRDQGITCDNLPLHFQDYFFYARTLHLYDNDRLLVASNTYARNGIYLNGLVVRLEKDRRSFQCLYGEYYTDIVWDETLRQYYTLSYLTDELLVFDPDFHLINRVVTPDRPVDIFLDERPDGQRIILVTCEWGLFIHEIDATTMTVLGTHHPFESGQYHSTIDPQQRLMFASTVFPYIAAKISLDEPSRHQRGVRGLVSWGSDYDPVGNHMYVADFFFGLVTKIDAESMKGIKSRYFRPGLRPIVFDEQRKLLFIGSYHSKDILVLDEELHELGRLRSAGTTRNMVLTQDNRTLYLAGMGGIYAIDLDAALAEERIDL